MRVMAQLAMVMNLDKCIGCHTCSVTCKQAWTNRSGTEYVWFNNVETRPGQGYPRRYEDQETWKGGCLARIASRTEEHGHVTTVAGRQEGDVFRIDGDTKGRLQGCVMSFAYWNPRVLKQASLINVQTGASTPITVHALDKEAYTVRGASVEATHYRIDTARNKIEVWYSPDGEWIGLRSTSQQGHVLAYRLK